MSAPIIQAEYDALNEIAQRFRRQSEAQEQLRALLQRRFEPLQHGGWIGRGAKSFFSEMENEVFPATTRLSQALAEASRVTLQIASILRDAEQEGAAPFGGAKLFEGRSPGSADIDGDGATGGTAPPPRVYIVNGINSAGDVPGEVGDDQTVALRHLLERWGYDPNQIVPTHAIFQSPRGTMTGTNLSGTHFGGLLSPIDWLTQGAASAVNAVTGWGSNLINNIVESTPYGALYGSWEVLREYDMGIEGPYTNQVFREIENDLKRHPLLPGQSIILIGHSGGGAVVTNLAGMVERQLGADVSGVITMGSPVANYDEAGRYAETIVQIRHQNDLIGLPLIRSEESREALPEAFSNPIAWLAFEYQSRQVGDHPHVVDITLQTPAGGGFLVGPHNAYMDSENTGASTEMMLRLHELFPQMQLRTTPSSP